MKIYPSLPCPSLAFESLRDPRILQKNPRRISAWPRKISGNPDGRERPRRIPVARDCERKPSADLLSQEFTHNKPAPARQEVNVSRSEKENQIRPSSRHVPKHGAMINSSTAERSRGSTEVATLRKINNQIAADQQEDARKTHGSSAADQKRSKSGCRDTLNSEIDDRRRDWWKIWWKLLGIPARMGFNPV